MLALKKQALPEQGPAIAVPLSDTFSSRDTKDHAQGLLMPSTPFPQKQ